MNLNTVIRYGACLAFMTLLLGTGCKGCTEIGCTSGIAVDFNQLDVLEGRTVSITGCVQGHCTTYNDVDRDRLERMDGGLVFFRGMGGDPRGGTIRVVDDATGGSLYDAVVTEIAKPRVFRPNGNGCPPTCHISDFVATEEAKLRPISQ